MNDKAIERRFNILPITNMDSLVLEKIYQKLLSKFKITTITLEDFNTIQSALNEVSNRNYPDKLIDFIDLYEAMEKLSGKITINDVIKRGFYDI